ncbi:hypothetical protein EYF80_038642 [Liparis tanakae]|uniref:Uncharacterized protein n=1 Tax=Liparis tanakae TaxID=230148 RepID=A0A4Z2GER7_9TELE|nr:hypothetical protein EYF80_038642 [Liparis tanakae]
MASARLPATFLALSSPALPLCGVKQRNNDANTGAINTNNGLKTIVTVFSRARHVAGAAVLS